MSEDTRIYDFDVCWHAPLGFALEGGLEGVRILSSSVEEAERLVRSSLDRIRENGETYHLTLRPPKHPK